MEPLSVFRTIWRQRRLALPAIVLTLVAAALVFVFGPREYESTISYALVDPQVPTEQQIQENPALKQLNSNNPYLRSSDPDLIANVLITRLNAASTQDALKREGLSGTYQATPGEGGQGLIVTMTASGDSARQSLATTRELGRIFQVDLRRIQKVNDADDRYLFTSIVVDEPDRATEKLSSRLRTVIIVFAAGIVLIFGAVSLGNAIDRSRRRRAEAATTSADEATETVPAAATPAPDPAGSVAMPDPVPAPTGAARDTSLDGTTPPEERAAPTSAGSDPDLAEETTERSPARPATARTASPRPRKPRQRRPSTASADAAGRRDGGSTDDVPRRD